MQVGRKRVFWGAGLGEAHVPRRQRWPLLEAELRKGETSLREAKGRNKIMDAKCFVSYRALYKRLLLLSNCDVV